MIPPFEPDGNLPPGVHWASWEEFVNRYSGTSRRRYLMAGLERAIASLRAAGCRTVYIDGSFVTSKAAPGDFDGCWDRAGVSLDLLDPILWDPDDLRSGRRGQKAAFGGELFLADQVEAGSGSRFLEFFQIDRRTGDPKGIIAIDLRTGQVT
jgi:hypothetical protein